VETSPCETRKYHPISSLQLKSGFPVIACFYAKFIHKFSKISGDCQIANLIGVNQLIIFGHIGKGAAGGQNFSVFYFAIVFYDCPDFIAKGYLHSFKVFQGNISPHHAKVRSSTSRIPTTLFPSYTG
jgi:hypothetical protein